MAKGIETRGTRTDILRMKNYEREKELKNGKGNKNHWKM